jgi:hypothetical protein
MAGLKLTAEEREIIINALVENEAIEEGDRELYEGMKSTQLAAFAQSVLNSDESEEDEDDDDDDEVDEDLVDDISDELEDDEDSEDEEEEIEEDEEVELATNKGKVPPQFLKHMKKKKGKKGSAKEEEDEEPTGNSRRKLTCNKCGGNSHDQEDYEMKNLTANEWLESAPPEIAEVVNNAMKFANDEKAKRIEKLTANLSGAKKTDMIRKLANNSLEALDDLLSLIPEQSQQVHVSAPVAGLSRARNFSGAATPGSITANKGSQKREAEPLVVPTINWKELSSEFASQN